MARPLAVRMILSGALAASVILAGTEAEAGDAAAAREQVKIGYLLAKDGKCEEAIPHFVESVRLDPRAVTLINLADCEEKTDRLADALARWVEARARAQAENNRDIQNEAESRAKELEPRVPRLTVVLPPGAPKDAEVTRDGVVLGPASMGVPLPINPGPHTLVLRASGRRDASVEIAIREAETARAELPLGEPIAPPPPIERPPPPSGHTSPLVYGGFGAAVVGVAVGTVTGILAFGKASDVESACPTPSRCSQAGLDEVDRGRALGTISTVAFVVGGLGAAVGVYGLVWGKPSNGASVALDVGPASGTLRGTF